MKKGCFPIVLVVVILGIGFGVLIVRDQVFGQQSIPIHTTGQPNHQLSGHQLPVYDHNAQLPTGYTYPVVQPPLATPQQQNQHQQVTVRLPAEPPKWLVEFTHIDDPINPSQKIMAITVVDPESKRILIYHANLSFGALKFISSRDILPDIMLGEYNAVPPTPREIMTEIERLKNNK
ncbi:MAG: hypothetical protein LBT09_14540 [Planctomycetaceae bacterium]|jgi:hypothetical protein|nr:hypothetical protein [Planctomycetaceae bacterium]